jgi:DNA-binding response OmpR family regulator
MRLLLAEDEEELANPLVEVLKRQNYVVDLVYNGQDAYDWAIGCKYDGIILDIMMPVKNGLEVLQELRALGIDTPVLLLTARTEVEDRVKGLDLGADDYLTKPFAMKELLARIRAMTRRTASFEPNVLTCGELSLDRGNFSLGCGGSEVTLAGKEYQIMELLMRNQGRLVSTEQFMEQVWGYDTDSNVNGVWVYISNLRKKLVQLGSPMEIKAARGQGYKLEARGE